MREVQVTLPELALLVGTRAALGAGLGLLLADCLPERRTQGCRVDALLVGAVSTVPLAFESARQGPHVERGRVASGIR